MNPSLSTDQITQSLRKGWHGFDPPRRPAAWALAWPGPQGRVRTLRQGEWLSSGYHWTWWIGVLITMWLDGLPFGNGSHFSNDQRITNGERLTCGRCVDNCWPTVLWAPAWVGLEGSPATWALELHQPRWFSRGHYRETWFFRKLVLAQVPPRINSQK